MRWATFALVVLLATAAGAAEPCPAGRFVVVEGTLLPEAGAGREFVVLDAETVGVTSGCPEVPVRLRARRSGVTRVRAAWPKATPCAGLVAKAKLGAKIVESCTRLEGKLVARKATPRRRRFVALRSTCGDGIADTGGGEACDGADASACPNGCEAGCVCSPLRGLVAITDTNTVIRFSADAPAAIIGSAPVTGLEAGETLVGIDFRPATGHLFALGVLDEGATDTVHLYRLEPLSGVATLAGPAITGLNDGGSWGIDVNPVADRIRVVNDADENLRLNPNTGVRSDAPTNDADLNPANAAIVAVAHTNNFAGAAVTMLYGISFTQDRLYVINPPNAGTLSEVGPLGIVSTFSSIGFDVDGTTGTAFATIAVAGETGLYRVDLNTGAVTLVGLVGDGTLRLPGLAVAPGGAVP